MDFDQAEAAWHSSYDWMLKYYFTRNVTSGLLKKLLNDSNMDVIYLNVAKTFDEVIHMSQIAWSRCDRKT